jgi:hypothetical protein
VCDKMRRAALRAVIAAYERYRLPITALTERLNQHQDG